MPLNDQSNVDPSPPSPVDQLYLGFTSIFGNTNPGQVFTLIWPGTVLDPSSYASDPATDPLGVLSGVNQSLLFDQYYPVATITQPDGTRVSDRYAQTIEHYGIVPNPQLAALQATIRDRLAQTTEMSIDGKPVTMTLLDQFEYLNSQWTALRQDWATVQTQQMNTLRAADPTGWFADFVMWYELVAQSYIDAINGAYDRLIATFPLNAFQCAITILDTKEAAALERAKTDMANAAVPVPSTIGSTFVTAQAVPADWGNTMIPSTTFIDLLASPDVQERSLRLAIAQLQQQTLAWNAVLAQIPAGSQQEIQQALEAFNTASSTYSAAIDKVLGQYTDNTVTAVKAYMQYESGQNGGDNEEPNLAEVNEMKKELDEQSGEADTPLTQDQLNEIVDAIGAGQKALITANSSMVQTGVDLANKATDYLKTSAGAELRKMIEPVIAQLQAQLAVVEQQVANFNSSAQRSVALTNDDPPKLGLPTSSDSLADQRWTEITLTVDQTNMNQSSSTSTSFSQMNWSVDLFFGSAGGQSSEASSAFAAKYMASGGHIEIGMLATKVLIERPWMHPEIFNLSANYFRGSNDPLTTPASQVPWSRPRLVPSKLDPNDPSNTTDAGAAQVAVTEINGGPFPAYPVALLIVKDVTIKMKLTVTETEALANASSSNSSQGGGFLCFSVSKTQSASSSSNSSGSYAMAGDYVFRIASPQVIGAWLQITPPDQSQILTPAKAQEIADSLGFITRLKNVAQQGQMVAAVPTKLSRAAT
jgi:hypothetical protein